MKGSSIGVGQVLLGCGLVTLIGVGVAGQAHAGIKVYEDDDKYVKLGGRIQLQYHQVKPDGVDSTDDLLFRRLRPYIEGSFAKGWMGKFQWDMGTAADDNEMAIKDAYFQYKTTNGIKVMVGNANFPFSRELLTSSKKQQLVERTFVGDHNYGTPDRQAGVHLTGHFIEDKKVTWGASLAQAALDPDDDKLDFDTIVNRNDDFNEGWMVGGRLDFHPMGHLKMEQGDFKGKPKATFGSAHLPGAMTTTTTLAPRQGLATMPPSQTWIRSPVLRSAVPFGASVSRLMWNTTCSIPRPLISP